MTRAPPPTATSTSPGARRLGSSSSPDRRQYLGEIAVPPLAAAYPAGTDLALRRGSRARRRAASSPTTPTTPPPAASTNTTRAGNAAGIRPERGTPFRAPPEHFPAWGAGSCALAAGAGPTAGFLFATVAAEHEDGLQNRPRRRRVRLQRHADRHRRHHGLPRPRDRQALHRRRRRPLLERDRIRRLGRQTEKGSRSQARQHRLRRRRGRSKPPPLPLAPGQRPPRSLRRPGADPRAGDRRSHGTHRNHRHPQRHRRPRRQPADRMRLPAHDRRRLQGKRRRRGPEPDGLRRHRRRLRRSASKANRRAPPAKPARRRIVDDQRPRSPDRASSCRAS